MLTVMGMRGKVAPPALPPQKKSNPRQQKRNTTTATKTKTSHEQK